MYPSYLNISIKELDSRIEKASKLLNPCKICPRNCNVNRLKNKGFCNATNEIIISSYDAHFGEESVLVGSFGSGTIFFTNCNLACVYCQNYDISQLGNGNAISKQELAEIMLKLQDRKCHNINLVSPTPYIPQILASLKIAIKNGLKLPLVYNTGGYDSIETLKLLQNIIDIYMPDMKYSDNNLAKKYSLVNNYSDINKKTVKEMHNQVGDLIIENKIAKKGLLIRHLVLPNNLAGTEKTMQFLANLSKNTFINIMDQYHPCFKAYDYKELSRPITIEEFNKAIKIAKNFGLHRFD